MRLFFSDLTIVKSQRKITTILRDNRACALLRLIEIISRIDNLMKIEDIQLKF